MAGLEVAGVVLGSIPLIISALEHYSEGVSTIRSMRKYESVFEYLQTSFVTGLVIYRNALEELLSALALSDATLHALLEESASHAWEDPNLVAKLRDRLGSSYLPFKSSVKQLNKKIVLLGTKLQLDSSFKPTWIHPDGHADVQARDMFFKNPLNRIRGGFKAEKHKQLLMSLLDDINRIAALTSGAIALEPLRLSRKRASNTRYWSEYQTYAEGLYACLDTRWSVQCHCECRHEANLRLSLGETGQSPLANFSLVLAIKNDGMTEPPWTSCAIDVEPIGHPKLPVLASSGVAPAIKVESPSGPLWSQQHCSRGAPTINDLCSALADNAHRSVCMGIVDNARFKHHIHHASCRPLPESLEPRNTLRDLLALQHGKRFGIGEKCSLALALATAVMQLHDTPWLAETWTSNDICMFTYKKGGITTEQPFLSREVGSSNQTGNSKKRNPFMRNATVFALGVALLEISYGQPLQTFETQEDLDDNGNRTPFTECSIAYRLVEAMNQRELLNFANATRRCVHCSFDVAAYSLKDDDFRERFYQGVVVPLQQDYEFIK